MQITILRFLDDYHFEKNKLVIESNNADELANKVKDFNNILNTINYDYEVVVFASTIHQDIEEKN